jgi:hypothetical protein
MIIYHIILSINFFNVFPCTLSLDRVPITIHLLGTQSSALENAFQASKLPSLLASSLPYFPPYRPCIPFPMSNESAKETADLRLSAMSWHEVP